MDERRSKYSERRSTIDESRTMVATHSATRITDFLPSHNSTMARTGKRIEFLIKISGRDQNVKGK